MTNAITRRVTTGVNEQRASHIIADEAVSMFAPYETFPSFQLQNLFYTEDSPQSLATRHNNAPYDINLPTGAFRFLRIRMPTVKEMIADLQAAGQPVPTDWKTFNLHATDSVDYIYILSGKITCVVGTEELQLQTGDFLAQVGPLHTWINNHDEPCYLLCIMLGTAPAAASVRFEVA